MGDEKICKAHILLKLFQKVYYLRLNGYVKGGNGLIADYKARVYGKAARYSYALALPAGKLMGEAAGVILAKANLLQTVVYYPLPLLAGAKVVYVYAFAYYISYRHAGIQGGVGILEYHLSRPGVFAAFCGAELSYVLSFEEYFTRGGFIQLYQGAAYGGLSATGFAHKAKGLALIY